MDGARNSYAGPGLARIPGTRPASFDRPRAGPPVSAPPIPTAPPLDRLAPTVRRPKPVLLETLQAITGVFVVVYDGQHALKFTLGRAKYVVGPGVHWKWPIIQKFQAADTRHTTLDLEPQVIQLADDLVYEVDAKVIYQIVNLKKAKTVEGSDIKIKVKEGKVMINKALVAKADVACSNGVIHVIDSVILPPEKSEGAE